MANPWAKKNPLLSLWLSSAHAIAGAARGHASQQLHRGMASATRGMQQAVVEAWLSPFRTNPPRRRRKG
jgi:hypothetical protein